jgi:hypothetical protein
MNGFQRAIYGFFNSRGRKIVRELIITMCADDPEVLTRVRLQRVILRTENYISALPFFYFLVFKLALYMIQYALPPLSWKLRPFTWMSLERRLRYFEEWQGSGFYYKRALFKMVQCVCIAHLYSERRLLVRIGFEPSMEHRQQSAMSHARPQAESGA